MTTIQIDLPDDLAREAQAAGLLRSEMLASVLRELIREGRINRLFATMEKLSSVTPPLTDEEIAEEITAARVARRARNDATGS